MSRYVVLLRAVNVGGHNKVPMADFRRLLESLGHTEVVTYLQSGNAVFTSSKRNTSTLAAAVEQALHNEMGVDVRVLVLPHERLTQIVDTNPMVRLDDDPAHLYVAFLSGTPKPGAVDGLDALAFAPDRFEIVGDVMYLHYPNGMGHSKLDPGKVSARMGMWATARNWRTVNQLLELAAST